MPPTEISFSRLQSYLRCPWQYHLVYDLGWRSGPSAPAAFGQSLHRALAAYLSPDNAEHTLQRLLEFYDEVWVNEGFSGTQETLDVYDRGRKMLEKFFESDQKRTSTVIGAEVEFSIPLNERIRFRGTLDRLDTHPDGTLEVVEYKSQGENWSPARMENDLQMTLYALGAQAAYQKDVPVKLTYHFLSTGERMSVTRSPEQLKAAQKLLFDVAGKIEAKTFDPNHANCPRCEFANRCENFKKSEERLS